MSLQIFAPLFCSKLKPRGFLSQGNEPKSRECRLGRNPDIVHRNVGLGVAEPLHHSVFQSRLDCPESAEKGPREAFAGLGGLAGAD